MWKNESNGGHLLLETTGAGIVSINTDLTIDGTFTDGTMSIASGSITNGVDGTFSGTIQVEGFISTDDAYITDRLGIGAGASTPLYALHINTGRAYIFGTPGTPNVDAPITFHLECGQGYDGLASLGEQSAGGDNEIISGVGGFATLGDGANAGHNYILGGQGGGTDDAGRAGGTGGSIFVSGGNFGSGDVSGSIGNVVLAGGTTGANPLGMVGVGKIPTDSILDVDGIVTSENVVDLSHNRISSQDLEAYWPANGNALDYSGNGHDGTFTDGADADDAGQFGNTFVFDGTNDYISVPDHADLSFGDGSDDSPFSIAAWVKVNTIADDSRCIINKGDAGNGYEWRLYLIDSKLAIRLYDASTGIYRGQQADNALPDTDWHFVVMTYDGRGTNSPQDGIVLYVDGKIVDDTVISSGGTYTAMEDTNSIVEIGSTAAGTAWFFRDNIDELMIFARELTAGEVKALFVTPVELTVQDAYPRYIDGNVLRLGDGTNYTQLSGTGDMLFVGDATVWNDLQFQISDAKVTPASLLPSWETFTTNTSEYAFSVNDEVDTSANEIPHFWKQGTAGNAHMHITTKAVPAQEEKARFTVTFAYADTDEVWVEAPLTAELTIPISTTALTNFYLDLGDITLTNYLIETQMRCRVKRIAKSAGGTEYGGDIFITQVGIHFERDTIGSRIERTK